MNLAVAICLLLLILVIINNILRKNKFSKSQEVLNSQYQLLNENFIANSSELKFVKSRLEEVNLLNNQLNLKLNQYYEDNLNLEKKISSLQVYNKALIDENENLKNIDNQIEKKFSSEFRNLATQIIEERSLKITEFNKKEITPMVSQLLSSIDNLRKQASEQLEQETRQRTKIENNLVKSIEETNRLNIEANNLVNALNSSSKIQGDWGEVIVETILQQSGLINGVNYFKQNSFKGYDQQELRPDFLINLPHENGEEKRVLIIDSKLSLNDFQRYINSEAVDDKKKFLKNHLEAIKNHIKNLAEKRYQEILGINSPDFIFAFIPIEPAYLLAIQADAELWNFAYQKKVILVSPTNFIACIRIVAELWRYQRQNKNSEKIVERANRLYEKIIHLAQNFQNIESNLDKAKESYLQVVKIFEGKGGIVSQANDLKKLGLKSNKTFSKDFGDMLDNQEYELENDYIESNQNKLDNSDQ
ncbi:MAG: DNA recombination protein RmuC [Rickettsiales bacterium]|nr:DNA recombination protein RmuC [Rickettsiales bacterium]